MYLSIGSNLGDRRKNLSDALTHLETDSDKVVLISPIYETEPWGNPDQPHFLNQAVLLSSELVPADLLVKIHKIEEKCGRVSGNIRYSARTLDIDILFYDDLILTSDNLTIPHPLLHRRRFVLIPLSDIAPDLRHPVMNRTIKDLIRYCDDHTMVKPFY